MAENRGSLCATGGGAGRIEGAGMGGIPIENEVRAYWLACEELRGAARRARGCSAKYATADIEAVLLHTSAPTLRQAAATKIAGLRHASAPTRTPARAAAGLGLGYQRNEERGPRPTTTPATVIDLAAVRLRRAGHPPGTAPFANSKRRRPSEEISSSPEL